jgi:hypothetical protein
LKDKEKKEFFFKRIFFLKEKEGKKEGRKGRGNKQPNESALRSPAHPCQHLDCERF